MENVADLARIATERLTAGGHHRGVVATPPTYQPAFSRRPTTVLLTAALPPGSSDVQGSFKWPIGHLGPRAHHV